MSTTREVQERQRIASLRQQQIRQRAPKSSSAARGRAVQAKQRPLLIAVFALLPGRWKGILAGAVVGTILSFFVSIQLTGDQRLLAILPLLGLIVAGYGAGRFKEHLNKR
ncbi:MAG: hypothetical protein IPK19_27620 [Chloroflexi bacterium]|nr:hypothetical protein [Chloroflexota bacterium]